jgi:glycosyltransferase involved in cell wall biosynthesis
MHNVEASEQKNFPLISIIVPFYKVEAYLAACLESIVNQTYKNIEILLIDDCSPDGCIDIARAYAAKDSRIRIIQHRVNKHVGGARNTGLDAARGEYIWFIDSDDTIAALDVVEKLVDKVADKHVDVLIFGAAYWTGHSRLASGLTSSYRYDEHQITKDDLYLGSHTEVLEYMKWSCNQPDYSVGPNYTLWRKLWRREFLIGIGARQLEKTVHQDVIGVLWLLAAQSMVVCRVVAYHYYLDTEENITNAAKPSNYYLHWQRLAQQQRQFYQDYLVVFEQPIINEMYAILTMRAASYSCTKNSFDTQTNENQVSAALDEEKLAHIDVVWQLIAEVAKVIPRVVRHWRYFMGEVINSSPLYAIYDALQQDKRVLEKLYFIKEMHYPTPRPYSPLPLPAIALPPEPQPQPKPEHLIKKIIKGVLPYALTEYLLKKRGWNIHISRMEAEIK